MKKVVAGAFLLLLSVPALGQGEAITDIVSAKAAIDEIAGRCEKSKLTDADFALMDRLGKQFAKNNALVVEISNIKGSQRLYLQKLSQQQYAVDAQKAKENADQENDRKFIAATPSECQSVPDKLLVVKSITGDAAHLIQIDQLARAGEKVEACKQLVPLITRLEDARTSNVTCYQALVKTPSSQYPNLAQGVLQQASAINKIEQNLKQVAGQYECGD